MEKLTVLLAGASGVFGREITAALTGAGHTVIGLGRGADNGVRADLLDHDGLLRAVAGHHADVVVHAATALRCPPMRHRDMAATDALRITGTRNLLDAAREVGATRVVSESMVFGYGDHGGRALAETDRWAPVQRDPEREKHVAAMRIKEELTLAAGGITLRYGLFYGGDATQTIVQMLRKRSLPLPGDHGRVLPWVDIADAAAAVVAAIANGRPGQAYNIAEGTPLGFREMATITAEAFGTPKPLPVPLWMLRPMGNLYAVLTTNLRVDSARAQEELGWLPRHPSARDNLAAQAAAR